MVAHLVPLRKIGLFNIANMSQQSSDAVAPGILASAAQLAHAGATRYPAEFYLYSFKIVPCAAQYAHNWSLCPFVHQGEKARRRDPRMYHYEPLPCPDDKKGTNCPRGDSCGYTHNVYEYWLHPKRFRTQMCQQGASCKRPLCFFAHSLQELRFADQQESYLSDSARAAGMASAANALKQQQQQHRMYPTPFGQSATLGAPQTGTYPPAAGGHSQVAMQGQQLMQQMQPVETLHSLNSGSLPSGTALLPAIASFANIAQQQQQEPQEQYQLQADLLTAQQQQWLAGYAADSSASVYVPYGQPVKLANGQIVFAAVPQPGMVGQGMALALDAATASQYQLHGSNPLQGGDMPGNQQQYQQVAFAAGNGPAGLGGMLPMSADVGSILKVQGRVGGLGNGSLPALVPAALKGQLVNDPPVASPGGFQARNLNTVSMEAGHYNSSSNSSNAVQQQQSQLGFGGPHTVLVEASGGLLTGQDAGNAGAYGYIAVPGSRDRSNLDISRAVGGLQRVSGGGGGVPDQATLEAVQAAIKQIGLGENPHLQDL